jgi:hypothetical protein
MTYSSVINNSMINGCSSRLSLRTSKSRGSVVDLVIIDEDVTTISLAESSLNKMSQVKNVTHVVTFVYGR